MAKFSPTTEIAWMFVLGMSCLACAVGPHVAYKEGMQEQLPSDWEDDSSWLIVLADLDGSILRAVTVQLTSDPGDACWEGDWLTAEVLSIHPPHDGRYRKRAAYKTSGAGILLILNSDLCDVDHRLYGKVTGEGIFGDHSSDSFSAGENGRFYALPTHPPNADCSHPAAKESSGRRTPHNNPLH